MRLINLAILTSLFSLTFLYSCHGKRDHKAEATAQKMNGVYVFIKSKPISPYDVLGTIDTKWYDRLLKLNEQNVFSIINNIKNTVSFSGNLSTIIDEVEQKYPTADAIIFDDNMSSCDVIKFKN